MFTRLDAMMDSSRSGDVTHTSAHVYQRVPNEADYWIQANKLTIHNTEEGCQTGACDLLKDTHGWKNTWVAYNTFSGDIQLAYSSPEPVGSQNPAVKLPWYYLIMGPFTHRDRHATLYYHRQTCHLTLPQTDVRTQTYYPPIRNPLCTPRV